MVRNIIREEWEVLSEREMIMWEKTEPIQWKSTWKTATQSNLITIQCQETYLMNWNCKLKNILNKKWIVHFSSSYSSPVVVVRKKDGSIRMCCDYRKLNDKTITNKHPLLRIQNILNNLDANQYFTLLDQSKAHHQLHLYPDSRKLTVFITPMGFLRMG